MRPDKTFTVPVSNGLLEHCPVMRDAIWLFLYLIDKQTKGVNSDGNGKVLGGVPIRDSDIAGTLRIERRTVIRWRAHLSEAGYITARRTPYGHVYAIQKPKKWKDQTGQKCPISAVRDVTQTVHLSGVEMSHTLPGDVTQTDKRCHIPGTNKEEVTREYSSSSTKTPDAATAVSQDQMAKELQIVWSYYDKHEIISPSAKKVGIAVLAELRRRFQGITSEQCTDAMTAAIDRARHLVETQPKKSFFSKWHAIFGRFDTFFSLWEEAT